MSILSKICEASSKEIDGILDDALSEAIRNDPYIYRILGYNAPGAIQTMSSEQRLKLAVLVQTEQVGERISQLCEITRKQMFTVFVKG